MAGFVVPSTLATPEDLADWTGTTAPANAAQLLRSATTLVLDATEGAHYPVDEATGLSTDTQVLEAMRDATCIQAAAWAAINYNPLTGGVATSTVKRSKKIGSGSIELAGADAAARAQAAAARSLVPDAIRKLQQNNLLGYQPWSRG